MRCPIEIIGAPTKMGHPSYEVNGYERALFGRGQVIVRDAETGILCTGSDSRPDGCAITPV